MDDNNRVESAICRSLGLRREWQGTQRRKKEGMGGATREDKGGCKGGKTCCGAVGMKGGVDTEERRDG